MATGVLAPTPTRPRLGWQRRLRRKLVILDVTAGLAGALGTVLIRYDAEAVKLGGVDYRAWAVIVGALLWSAVQLRWVWTRKLYYVPPPAPPPSID